MARPLKYKYDPKEIEMLLNKGFSIRGVAKELNYGHVSLSQWLNRNYTISTTKKLIPKNKAK
jgi:phage antirepressor YoqD-like protein